MNRMIEAAADTVVSTVVSRNVRTGLDADTLRRAVFDYLFFFQGRHPDIASRNDLYLATAYAVRDRLFQRGVKSLDLLFQHPEARVVAYLSAEFLIGPQLAANLVNLGIYDAMQRALADIDVNLDDLIEHEQEPGLGNGGLGRLAACYLDSLATLEVPAIGYGIRYEFGIFDQVIRDGWQVEHTDNWLHLGYPWEVARPERSVEVKFGGHTEKYTDEHGRQRTHWHPAEVVRGVPHDTPVLGYRVETCNLLRLWRAQAVETFDFAAFNVGDYHEAVEQKVTSETISKVLYPNDMSPQGKVLRLKQQYFLVACAMQDMLRSHLRSGGTPETFDSRWAAQLNDTHPAVAVAELMRLLLDDHGLDWEVAWEVTQKSMAYTNHTLLPEALETWSVDLFGSLLPRHLEIVFEINRRLLDDVRHRFPGEAGRVGAHVADRGERRPLRAHGQSGLRRQSCHQRRRHPAYRAPETAGPARLGRDVSGTVHQHHQRGDAAPVHGDEQSGPERTDHRKDRRRLADPSRCACAGWKRSYRTPRFASAGAT